METTARVLNILIRVCGGAALALGFAFWLGYLRFLTQVHIGLGLGLVLSLWALAGIAWRKTARRRLAAFASAWGLVSWVLGVTQSQILPGSLHGIVEAAHLGAGVIAIAIGGQLASAVSLRRTASSIST
jgi:hypothetical protein